MKGLIYVVIILLVGAAGGYLVADKVNEWRALKVAAKQTSEKTKDVSAEITEMFNREKLAYQNHDADQLLNDCISNYTEVDGNSGETMDLARSRLFYHQYFKSGQAVNLALENVQINAAENAVVAQADYKKMSNSFNERNVQGYKGHGIWVFVRQNSTWRLASLAWAEQSF